MPLVPRYFTAEMVRALPEDGQRYEVVHGELLVTPAPTLPHQRVVTRLVVALAPYCERLGLGEVLTSPADVSWGEDVLVQPDVFVTARDEAGLREWSSLRTLDLVVEVLSPSTAKQDRFQKRRLYQRQGVETLWIVDIDRALVEVWTPDAILPLVRTEELVWHPPGAAEPLVIPVAGLFAP